MAMSLADAGVPTEAYRIDAMDLSNVALERARAGWYTKNAFRGRAVEFRARHFSAVGNGYQIADALRDQVTFMQANILAIDAAASAGRYDVIFCRNLLIYFDEPTTAAAIAVLRTLLADEGMLLAGYAEVPSFCANGFAPLRLPGAFALQKATAKLAPAPVAPPPAPRRSAMPRAPMSAVAGGKAAAPAAAKPAEKPIAAAPPVDLLAQARRQADNADYRAAAASCHQLLKSEDQGLEPAIAADAYYLLGLVADIEHKNGAADDYWRRCVYLVPDHYEALCRLALLSEQLGNASQAAILRQRAARVFQRRQASEGTR